MASDLPGGDLVRVSFSHFQSAFNVVFPSVSPSVRALNIHHSHRISFPVLEPSAKVLSITSLLYRIEKLTMPLREG
jgi:hypothetical protein